MSFAVKILVAEFEDQNAYLVSATEVMLGGFVADRRGLGPPLGDALHALSQQCFP